MNPRAMIPDVGTDQPAPPAVTPVVPQQMQLVPQPVESKPKIEAAAPDATIGAPDKEAARISGERAQFQEQYPHLSQLTYEQLRAFSPLIANSKDPMETSYQLAEALQYSDHYAKPLMDVMSDIGTYRQAWLGRDFSSAKDGWGAFRDSVKIGEIGQQINELGKQWKANGGDMNDPVYKTILDLQNLQLQLTDRAPRSAWVEAWKIVGNSLPFTVETVAKGAAMGAAATAGVLAAGALAAPAAALALGGSAYMVGAGAAMGGIVSRIASWQASQSGMEGSQYVQMRQDGANHKASATASTAVSFITGAIEVAFGTAPEMLGAIGGKLAASKIASTLAGHIFASGALSRVAAAGFDWLASGFAEGFAEEGPQTITENLGRRWALEQTEKDNQAYYNMMMAFEPIKQQARDDIIDYMNE